MASNNIARLGVVLGLDTAEFSASVDKAIAQNKKLANEIKKDSNASVAMLAELKYATEDYGKTLTKVQLIQREIDGGRAAFATKDMKEKLLAQAAAYDAVAAAAQKAGKAQSGLTGFQQQNLMYQTTDFVTQVASGQNVLISALQQGGQLKDVMGGIGPMFSALGGMIFSTTGAVVGLGAAFAGLSYSVYKAQQDLSELNKTIVLTGNYAQINSTQFEALAKYIGYYSQATTSGARDILGAMMSSGQFTKATFESTAKVIQRYAELSGLTQKEAADKLIPALDGSAASAKKLNDVFNFLTLDQYKHIESLNKMGKKSEAIIEINKLLNDSWKDQRTELGFWGSVFNDLSKIMTDLNTKWTNLFKGDNLQEQLAKINQKIKETKAATPGFFGPDEKELEKELIDLKIKRADLLKKIDKEQNKSKKMEGQKEAIDTFDADKAAKAQLDKQIASTGLETEKARALKGADARKQIETNLQFQLEKIDADYLENKTEKYAKFGDKVEQLREKEKQKAKADAANALFDLNRQNSLIMLDARKTERDAKYIALIAWQDEEHKLIEEGTAALLDIRDKYNRDIIGKDAGFVAARTALFKAEIAKEIAIRDSKLDAYYDKQRIKNVDAAIKEREDRQKITDEENKLRFERVQADVDFYTKAKDASDVQKEKLDTQIKMVGLSEKEVKLAEIELQYQRELKRLESSGLYDPNSLEEMKKKAAAKKADLSLNIEIADQLKETQRINDTVWNNMNNALDNFVESGILSFHDLAGSIIKDLMKIELKASAMNLWRALSGGNGLTGLMAMMSTGAFLGAPITGMTQSQFQMPEFADGGSPPVGMPSLVGERGPEIFVPKTAGTIIPNNQLGSMGGTTNVTNYNINAIDTKSFEDRILGSSKAVWAANAYGAKNISVGRGRT